MLSDPFTSTVITACPSCHRVITPATIVCPKCRFYLLRFTWQPKQRRLRELIHARGSNVATKLGFGGSRGSSKSRAGRDIALDVAIQNPGVLVYIVARNWVNLDDNYLKKYEIERPEIMEYYRASPHPEITLPPEWGGSTIAFRYADNERDMTRLERGPEAFLIIVEQAESFTEKQLIQINTPNRWPSAEAGAPKTLYLFNPGGPGTDYLRRVFYLQQYHENERPSDYAFIQAFGFDNWAWFSQECPELTFESFYKLPGEIPECPEGVYDDEWLSSVADHHRFKIFVTRTSEGRKMWAKPMNIRLGDLFGSFSKFAGQYFGEVWDEKTCVIPTHTVDALAKFWWPIWVSMDWGYGHYSAVYWFCIGKISPKEALEHLEIQTKYPLDIVICYRELVVQRMPERELAKRIAEMTPRPEREEIRKFVAGSDVFMMERKVTHTINELLEDVLIPEGFPRLQPARDRSGSRVISARMMFEGFRRTSSMRSDNPPQEQPDYNSTPLLLISSDCPEIIESLPLLIDDSDRGKPDDVKKLETKADDCFDGFKMGFVEHGEVRMLAPRAVRREEAINRADSMQGKYMNMLNFDQAESASERRGRKR